MDRYEVLVIDPEPATVCQAEPEWLLGAFMLQDLLDSRHLAFFEMSN
jgi:hypothetical protein